MAGKLFSKKKWLPNKSFGQAKGSLHKSPSIHPYSTQKPSEKKGDNSKKHRILFGDGESCWVLLMVQKSQNNHLGWAVNNGVSTTVPSTGACPAGFQNHQHYIPLRLDILLTYQTFGPAKRKISALTFRWICSSDEELRASQSIYPPSKRGNFASCFSYRGDGIYQPFTSSMLCSISGPERAGKGLVEGQVMWFRSPWRLFLGWW